MLIKVCRNEPLVGPEITEWQIMNMSKGEARDMVKEIAQGVLDVYETRKMA